MHIAILSDGIPGHLNQSLGLLAWLQSENNRAVTHETLDCQLQRKWARRGLASACNQLHYLPALATSILSAYKLQQPQKKPDLLISAGGNTSYANCALSNRWACPNLFLGSQRRLRPGNFSGLLTLEPTPVADSSNIVMPFAPSPVAAGAGHPPRENVWGLLLGGDGSGYEYREQDWQALLGWAAAIHRQYGIRWVIATSRRSPQMLRGECQRVLGDTAIFAGCWAGHAGAADFATSLPDAGRIFCTEDSMSMLSDAFNLGRPVTSLRPDSAAPPARYQAALAAFEAQQLLARWNIADLNTDALQLVGGAGTQTLASERLLATRRQVIRAIALRVRTVHDRAAGTVHQAGQPILAAS
ncbi:ELM1/GtrOC1 family putative glycosyltransferase [uncultured Microbulbifer sp.]|uniref:ELM1/GtrOC1 family putative glycosyltransferase n=1 Tax=uncultured Microbulbifer sp. TaxID=348147 RepID=UPI0025D4AC23|nr:ELM1/GtrOC1 family putative glycosyltransferase [uncultured Microbulbifer sp.]